MAKYFLHIKTFSRAKGSRATKAAAYRAGERIRDERSGDSYNYSAREDVADKDIVLPSELAAQPEMDWARDRRTLWNAAEHAGRLRNSRVAREVLVILPPEFTRAQRAELVRGFAQELADKYRCAVDFAVHLPRAGSDQRHHHAHLLMTTREVTLNGLGPRTTLELSGTERHARGLGPSRLDIVTIRERWAEVTNGAFRSAGLADRVDHRSYKAQGLNREPVPMMPQRIFYQERLSGINNPAGDEIRARHCERIEARAQGGDALARVLQKQRLEASQRINERAERIAAQPPKPARGSLTREELKEKRREYRKANAAEFNRKQRERRRANVDEVNRQQREYLKLRNAQKAARIAAGVEPAPTRKARTPAAEREAPPLAADTLAPTAKESAQNWLTYRESLKTEPTTDSLDQWRAYREQVGVDAPSRPPKERGTAENSRFVRDGKAEPEDDEPPQNQKRRDYGAGL